MKKNKKIIVLGTTYSGSGAVYDYLANRGDGHDPLAGEEYLLPQIPYGLMCLRSALGESFHHAVADHAVRQFLSVAEKLAPASSRTQYGKGYGVILPSFLEEVRQLVRDATVSEFPFQLDWRKAEETRMTRTMKWAMARFLKYNSQPEKTWLPVSEEEFVRLTRAMHDRLFKKTDSSSTIFTLLNQAGSGWNPVASTDFFSNRKVVLVTRDPRDQFAELKVYKKARDVDEFIKWYKAMQQRIDVQHPDLFIVRFEDFVLDHQGSVSSLCEFTGVDATVPSTYSAERSAVNILKYQETLSPSEVDRIERKLGQYIWDKVE